MHALPTPLRQLIKTVTRPAFVQTPSARRDEIGKPQHLRKSPDYQQDTFWQRQFPRSINQRPNALIQQVLWNTDANVESRPGKKFRYSPEKISNLPSPFEENEAATLPAVLEDPQRGKTPMLRFKKSPLPQNKRSLKFFPTGNPMCQSTESYKTTSSAIAEFKKAAIANTLRRCPLFADMASNDLNAIA
jgi:hypothetical protein